MIMTTMMGSYFSSGCDAFLLPVTWTGGCSDESAETCPVNLVKVFLDKAAEPVAVNLVKVALHKPPESGPVNLVKVPLPIVVPADPKKKTVKKKYTV